MAQTIFAAEDRAGVCASEHGAALTMFD